MAPHSSTLAWKIPCTEEPGRLQAMGSQRGGHDWATSLSLFTFMHWRRKWQPTPVFLPGESQGTEEPSGLLSMGSHRVGHNWSDLAAAAAHIIRISPRFPQMRFLLQDLIQGMVVYFRTRKQPGRDVCQAGVAQQAGHSKHIPSGNSGCVPW